jgi:hypothetical protein
MSDCGIPFRIVERLLYKPQEIPHIVFLTAVQKAPFGMTLKYNTCLLKINKSRLNLDFANNLLIFELRHSLSFFTFTNRRVQMGRTSLAAFLGALVLFIWGFLSWEVLPFHSKTMHTLPNEDAVVTTLKSGNAESGTYMIPGTGDGSEAAKKAAMNKMKTGPMGWLMYSREGMGEMHPMNFIKGFIVLFFSAMIAASLLGKLSWSLASKYGARVRFVMMLGIFLAIAGRLGDWAFMGYSTDFSLNLLADDIIGWTLAGMVIAWRIKPLMTKTS